MNASTQFRNYMAALDRMRGVGAEREFLELCNVKTSSVNQFLDGKVALTVVEKPTEFHFVFHAKAATKIGSVVVMGRRKKKGKV